MSEWFHVGQKVVCVDDSEWSAKIHSGTIYTISAIGPGPLGDETYIGLFETPCDSGPLHWRASRFRPLHKRTTDISVFTQLLDSTPKQVELT